MASEKKYKKVRVRRMIDDIDELLNIVADDGFIMGGFVRWCASPHKNPVPFYDIDVYSKNRPAYERIISRARELSAFERWKGTPNSTACVWRERRVQFIQPKNQGRMVGYGSLEEILDNFDFTVCKAALLNKEYAIVHKDFEEHEENKLLIIDHVHCPIGTLVRVLKYVKKGYFIKPLELLKLFYDWDSRPAEYKSLMAEALNAIENFDPSDPEQERFMRFLYEQMFLD